MSCAMSAMAQPNLTPFQPMGWSDKVVVTRTNGGTIDSTGLTTVDALYVDFAVINDGTAALGTGFAVALCVDGSPVLRFNSSGSLPVSCYAFFEGYVTSGN